MHSPGTVLGNYVIQRHLGSGSFGHVYLAAATETGLLVALKVTRSANPEAAVLRCLNHASIPSVLDEFSAGTEYVTAMQYVDGVSLASILAAVTAQSRDRLLLRDVLSRTKGADDFKALESKSSLLTSKESFVDFSVRIAGQVAAALAHAHACGIFHRDVKPENILIDQSGNAFLIDWGMATGDCTPQSPDGGTLAYMPRAALIRVSGVTQLAESGRPHGDADADLYATGIVLYELLTGELPFPPPTEGAPVVAQARELLAELSLLPLRIAQQATLPADLKSVISMCTACANPSDNAGRRYSEMQQLVDDLARVRDDRPLLWAPEGIRARAERLWKRFRVVRIILMLTAAVGGLTLGIDRYQTSNSLAALDRERRSIQANGNAIDITEQHVRMVFQTGLFPDSSSLRKKRALVAHGLAAVCLDHEQFGRAAELLERAIPLYPDDGDMHNNLGKAYFHLQKFPQAIQAYNRALAIKGENDVVLSNRGAAYVCLERTEEAEKDFLRAIELNSANDAARLHLSWIRSKNTPPVQ